MKEEISSVFYGKYREGVWVLESGENGTAKINRRFVEKGHVLGNGGCECSKR